MDAPPDEGINVVDADRKLTHWAQWITSGWKSTAKLEKARVHELRHTFGQRLREAGVSEEDSAMLLGHAIAGMAQHSATATIVRLVTGAHKVQETLDRTTLLRVVNG